MVHIGILRWEYYQFNSIARCRKLIDPDDTKPSFINFFYITIFAERRPFSAPPVAEYHQQNATNNSLVLATPEEVSTI